MKRRSKWQILLCLMLAFAVAASIMLPSTAFADEGTTETDVTDLTITGLVLPEAGSAFPAEASVVSSGGDSWQIPVFWIDEDGSPADGVAGEETYYPVFVFFIPDEILAHLEAVGSGDFRLFIDDAILALFGTDDFYTVSDAETGLTYITLGSVKFALPSKVPSYGPLGPDLEVGGDSSYRNPNYVAPDEASDLSPAPAPDTAETEPAPKSDDRGDTPIEDDGPDDMDAPAPLPAPVPAVTDEPAPVPADEEKDSGPSSQEEEPAPEEDPLPFDLIPVHCAKTAQNALEPEELAGLVDMIRYKIQPQAVNILLDRFPAFREAYDEGLVGQDLGLYIYAFKADKDGMSSHKGIGETWAAFAGHSHVRQPDDSLEYAYMMGVNARYFFEVDERNYYVKDKETGKYTLTQDEEKIQKMETTIIHEMLHLFMDDYNRVGMAGMTDPEMWRDPDRQDVKQSLYEETRFPTWFKEGLASAVQNNYQYRKHSFDRFRYIGDGEFDDFYTPENVLNAYQMTEFQWYPGARTFESHFDLETADDKKVDHTVDAKYVSGYLACLYLAELAANQKGESSVTQDETGSFIMKSAPLLEGINTILERLHNGETLDEVIEDISGGRFTDTSAFERNFIKGDDDSLDFCVVFLNYMQELSEESDREYLPNGSILLDFDLDYVSPLDRNVQGAQNAYVFADSNDYVPSTVEMLRAYTNGGTSRRGLYREEDFEDEDVLPADVPEDEFEDEAGILPEEDSEVWEEEYASDTDIPDDGLPQEQPEVPDYEELVAFDEEDAPVSAFESHDEESWSYEGDYDSQDNGWDGGWDGGWDDGE